MPNWCENTMIVRGSDEKIAAFIEEMKPLAGGTYNDAQFDGGVTGEVLDFSAVAPMPRILRDRGSYDTPRGKGEYGWYGWSVENWGTKWNASGTQIVDLYSDPDDENVIGIVTYEYLSAWSPAMKWQETVIAYYPDLQFRFEWREDGMNFAGEMEGYNGEVTEVNEGEVADYYDVDESV